jgi:hypothetical protein
MNRIIYKLDGDRWVLTELQDLVVGDRFKMFEPDDMAPVVWQRQTEFVADEAPYNESGIWGIRIKELK